MSRTGITLFLVGALFAAVGTAQYFLVAWLTDDPNPNPMINGMLIWAGWGVGGLLAAAGAVLAVLGTPTQYRSPRYPP